MRAVVQRVSSASVAVAGEEVARIAAGMLVLLGVAVDDRPEQAERMAAKLRALRIFDDGEGRMNESLGDREVLCVSQFTLLGDVGRGNRPSFVAAAPSQVAEPLYEIVCDQLDARRGIFGAAMDVHLVNDGPVTLIVDFAPPS